MGLTCYTEVTQNRRSLSINTFHYTVVVVVVVLVVQVCGATGKNMTVNGLRPGVSYTFYLAAGNAVGIGAAIKFRVRTPRRVSLNQQSGNDHLSQTPSIVDT